MTFLFIYLVIYQSIGAFKNASNQTMCPHFFGPPSRWYFSILMTLWLYRGQLSRCDVSRSMESWNHITTKRVFYADTLRHSTSGIMLGGQTASWWNTPKRGSLRKKCKRSRCAQYDRWRQQFCLSMNNCLETGGCARTRVYGSGAFRGSARFTLRTSIIPNSLKAKDRIDSPTATFTHSTTREGMSAQTASLL